MNDIPTVRAHVRGSEGLARVGEPLLDAGLVRPRLRADAGGAGAGGGASHVLRAKVRAAASAEGPLRFREHVVGGIIEGIEKVGIAPHASVAVPHARDVAEILVGWW